MSASAEPTPAWPLWVLTGIAILEGLALAGYGVVDAILAITQGVSGPAAVASPLGVLVQVVVLVALGLGMVAIGRAWHRRRRWARAPFVLAQLILGFILVSLAQASGATVRAIGIGGVVIVGVGLVVALMPVTRANIEPGD